MNKKIAVIIPSFNEEEVLRQTIGSLIALLPKEDIYYVDDESTDQSYWIAKSYLPNVVSTPRNLGKAGALNFALEHYHLADRYDYILPMDADTVITPQYLPNALPILDEDTKQRIACVVGKVVGRSHSFVTLYRMWEYEVAQTIHKKAQNILGTIIVCPGCATIYRSKVFKRLQFPTDTVTEDMDLTFMIHRRKLGRIVYANKATVITQDPQSVHDLVIQLKRWHTGFWQCVVKHNIPWEGQLFDAEVGLLACEGLFNGILMLLLFFLIPLLLIINPKVLAVPLMLDFFLFVLPSITYTAYKQKAWKIYLFVFHFYFLRFLNSFIFLYGFLKVVLGVDVNALWGQITRYRVKESYL